MTDENKSEKSDFMVKDKLFLTAYILAMIVLNIFIFYHAVKKGHLVLVLAFFAVLKLIKASIYALLINKEEQQ